MKIALLLILAVITYSCDTVDLNSEYTEFITGNSIDTDIHFMPEEKYSINEAQELLLKLKLITEKIFPCENYGLSTTQFIKGSELIIRFDEIFIPDLCFTALGPAISYIDLPGDTKTLTFINGNTVDKYAVRVDHQKVSITQIENRFTRSLHNETFRIPENSFAYVAGTNTDNTNIYYEFLSILEQNPAFTEFEFEFEGEGRIPYPVSSSGTWVTYPSKFFIYSDIEDFLNLADVLNEFSSENIVPNSGVSISIYGWDNIYYRSHVTN